VAKLLLATRSADKVREIREILSGAGVEVVSLADAHVGWRSAEEDLEEHDSFLANARGKAEYFSKLTGLPTVADDSGLEVLALGGQPGVRSRRFAPDGERLSGKALDEANNAELLRRLMGAPTARRRANYTCVAVFIRRTGASPEAFTGRCWGYVLEALRGSGGFGYDPLFYHEELGRTFGEAAAEEKHRVSHRGAAFRQLAEALAAEPLR
jgi:XTP/dITP diphosphohydrolase